MSLKGMLPFDGWCVVDVNIGNCVLCIVLVFEVSELRVAPVK
jgi:hypothetical protein